MFALAVVVQEATDTIETVILGFYNVTLPRSSCYLVITVVSLLIVSKIIKDM